ncbi:hypothetical protein NC653_018606 [Populus alba x Populus x berolinensis]|uniref:Uncharacterized protein n=1 Tax=Populus alba x Populus x berolinensis TaxID=444605 RepID=A0AAD6VW73_9ROSI|nr:hypothetical protein NC653_018606 [Populus alba x Populus x berolinensis]
MARFNLQPKWSILLKNEAAMCNQNSPGKQYWCIACLPYRYNDKGQTSCHAFNFQPCFQVLGPRRTNCTCITLHKLPFEHINVKTHWSLGSNLFILQNSENPLEYAAESKNTIRHLMQW